MRHFGPPGSPGLVNGVEPEIRDMLDRLLSDLDASAPVDVVDAYAYPLPVTVICRILGVPAADQENFHAWADAIVADIDSSAQADAAQLDERRKEAQSGVAGYVGNLLQQFRSEPSDTLLSHLANDPESDRMSDIDMVVTAVLLLIAGHETTVNLISNGVLTLLRHPEHLAHLREDPELAVPLVEELLRFEPPIQYLPQRSTVDDIEVGATTIPKGSRIVLLLAAGSRDPQQFTDPDRFVPGRSDNQHFGFGGGIHYCFGAPLARLEAQHALAEFARRVSNPRLVADPPPYRPSPVLRGPQHLLVEMDGVNAV
jgi:cytochrome P450